MKTFACVSCLAVNGACLAMLIYGTILYHGTLADAAGCGILLALFVYQSIVVAKLPMSA